MTPNRTDDALRALARRYAEQSGTQLNREIASVQSQGAVWNTSRLDRRVLTRRRTRNAVIATLAAAACVALVFISPIVQNLTSTPPSADAQGYVMRDPSAEYEIIPLGFTLPANLTESGFTQDYEKSVYTLSDNLLDDVVLTLEPYTDSALFASLAPLTIDGGGVYYTSTADFKLLTFEKDGVLYTMSCKYDINTLINLARAIL